MRWSVRRHGQPVELSPKEFAVLESLMTAFPAYLSAEDLLEKVWDENADPFTKTVTVTIGRLRHKLGQPQVIHTIPRVGYAMWPEPQAVVPHAGTGAGTWTTRRSRSFGRARETSPRTRRRGR